MVALYELHEFLEEPFLPGAHVRPRLQTNQDTFGDLEPSQHAALVDRPTTLGKRENTFTFLRDVHTPQVSRFSKLEMEGTLELRFDVDL